MHNFKTVKDVIEELQKFPMDAEVHIGHYEAFLDENLKQTNPARITDKEAYELFSADNIEYKTVYEWLVRKHKYEPRTCVVISTG
jgi:hypothetical protein